MRFVKIDDLFVVLADNCIMHFMPGRHFWDEYPTTHESLTDYYDISYGIRAKMSVVSQATMDVIFSSRRIIKR